MSKPGGRCIRWRLTFQRLTKLMKHRIKSIITEVSKIELFRNQAGFLEDWYSAYIIRDEAKKIVVFSQVLGLYRSVFFWRYAPRKFIGGSILNLMGLQLFRYLAYNMRYLARSQRGKMSSEIYSKGVLVKKELLSISSVKRVIEFYSRNAGNRHRYFEDFSELVISNTKGAARKIPEYESLLNHLLDDCGIREIGEDLTGLPLKVFPFISIIHFESKIHKTIQSDGQDTPHADVFYPSFKIFIYLNDVTVKNGAFRYLSGSQRFCIEAGVNAYKDSLRYYFKGGKRQIYPTDASAGLKMKECHWLSLEGKPGDAVVFNVQGIHRRGDFAKDKPRERIVLLVDFRQSEAPFHSLAANV